MSPMPVSFITDLIDLLLLLFHKCGVFASNGWHHRTRGIICRLLMLQLVGLREIRHMVP